MAAPRVSRKRTTLARRRRLDDEGDDMSVATEVADDSQSDVSVPSDIDEDADADNSDLSDVDSSPSLTGEKTKAKVNGTVRAIKPASRPDVTSQRVPSPPIARSDAVFTASKDTEMMLNGLNGLKGSDKAVGDEVVDFETGSLAVEHPVAVAPGGRPESFAERKRREHEEYKKKRDADPAFIPNRGAFFMHDQRSANGHHGARQFGPRGNGRGGRGGAIGGPYSPANLRAQSSEATDAPWQHDLHETLAHPSSQVQPPSHLASARSNAPIDAGYHPPAHQAKTHHARAPPTSTPKPPQNRNFSTTVHTHNALVRVFLPGMKQPIHFQNVPIKQHTRLPNHRPPLRRDKPVRISLPPATPAYNFPTVERSFIFIPRALRPNQQGFGRGRGRFGSFGAGYSSRRTSAYGGSVYSPSVAMSRRSSMAREMGRDSLVSPAGSIMSRPGGMADPSRPVVRLPPGGPKFSGPITSPQNGIHQSYPLPQKPTFRENWQGPIHMHQPRPQKTVSVAGIESPASMNFNPPQQQEQQPFHQQVPAHINGAGPSAEQPPFYPHARQLSFSQASNGTPLSNIPERAIHAPAFQPYQQQGFQPQNYAMAPGYYYPQSGGQQFAPPAGMVPIFQPNYVMPVPAPTVPATQPPAGQPNMLAYESNGMTYYVDQSQLYPAPSMEAYAQPSYAVPGMGGMLTPSPEGATYYYPQQAVYYPTQ